MARGRRGHTVSQFRRRRTGKNSYGEQIRTWGPVVQAGIACDIQLTGGSVQQREYGRVAESEHPFFANYDDIDELLPDDGLLVTESTLTPALVGRRFLVKNVLPYSERGGWQAVLSDTEEDFS